MNWLDTAIKALLTVISFILIAGISFLLLSALWRRLRVRREREHPINIHHKANFRAFYYLAIEAPQQPPLRFRWMAGNLPLVEVSQPGVDIEAAAPPAKATKATGKPAKTAGPASSSSPSNPARQRLADGGSKAMGKVSALANILGLVALLPGPLGAGARQRQQELRQAQVNAAKVAQAPKQAQQRMEVLQSESKKLGVKPTAAKQASASPASAVTVSAPATQVEEAASADDAPPVNRVQHPFSGFYCVQTVELDPGQTLPLKLIISPVTRRSPVGSFAYKILLQAAPVEHFQEEIPVLSGRGTVYYASVAVWRSLLPGFAGVLVLLLGLLFWFYLLAIIWYWWSVPLGY